MEIRIIWAILFLRSIWAERVIGEVHPEKAEEPELRALGKGIVFVSDILFLGLVLSEISDDETKAPLASVHLETNKTSENIPSVSSKSKTGEKKLIKMKAMDSNQMEQIKSENEKSDERIVNKEIKMLSIKSQEEKNGVSLEFIPTTSDKELENKKGLKKVIPNSENTSVIAKDGKIINSIAENDQMKTSTVSSIFIFQFEQFFRLSHSINYRNRISNYIYNYEKAFQT